MEDRRIVINEATILALVKKHIAVPLKDVNEDIEVELREDEDGTEYIAEIVYKKH